MRGDFDISCATRSARRILKREMLTSLDLNSGWVFKNRNPELDLERDFESSGWRTAQVPGTVHQDLMAHDLIPDPFLRLNENAAQWVGESDWLYRLEFELSAEFAADFSGRAMLHLDGLDTFARVWLNGKPILTSDNMFVPHGLLVRDQLRQGRNELRIEFQSALRRGRELELQNGGPRPLWNGDSSRLQVRKAQYHYGWDWGPTLIAAGLWRGVRLEFFEARIVNLDTPIEVNRDLGEAIFRVRVELDGAIEGDQVVLELCDPDGTMLQTAVVPCSETVDRTLRVHHPHLWWPHGYGEQALYSLRVTLTRDGTVLDLTTVKLGARRLRLVQEPVFNEPGSSFYFEINNLPVFAGGANWIPDDSFLPRIAPERYRHRVAQARDANMLMLRVWGGGIYEQDAFYEACDELGVLVWQDFMFACGIYPAHEAFLDSVRTEASANVRRLRHHPSLALWCGNNEDYQIAHSQGLYDPGLLPEQNAAFPARLIYERLLPEVLAELDPARPYTPGSPFGGFDPDDSFVGDKHVWSVWHREMHPIQHYPALAGRFVSEFGMQSAPALETIAAFTAPEDRAAHSVVMEHHNKAPDGHRRLAAYISDSLPLPSNLEDWVYATQFVQAEAMKHAYGGWRRRWRGPGRYAVGGALVWQLNDCWPVTSWSVIDSHGLPKPAHYTIQNELAPIALGLERIGQRLEIWAVNGTLTPQSLRLELRALTLGGQEIGVERRSLQLKPNRATELDGWEFPTVSEPVVIAARLLGGQTPLARASSWPEPFKHHSFPDPELRVTRTPEGLRLLVSKPAKGVWLEAAGAIWKDNFFDLMPGDDRIVRFEGSGRRIRVRWLGANGASEYTI